MVDNKKKIIIILIATSMIIMLILLILILGLKTKDTFGTDNNLYYQQQTNKISLKAKASGKTLKFTISLGDIQNADFNIEKSYTEEFDDTIELTNSHNNNQAEDDLTLDLEDNVEKCFYRVKVLNNGEIIYSNVVTIALKKPDSTSGEVNGDDYEKGLEPEINVYDEDYEIYDDDELNQFDIDYEEYLATLDGKIENVENYYAADIKTIQVEQLILSESEINLDMSGYKTATIQATVIPSSVDNATITWSSSDTSVVAVNENGKITAKSNGTATISAQTNNGMIEVCEVNVTTSASNISLSKTSINLDMLGTREATLTANITPSTVVNKSVIWTSSNENVAMVDSDGTVTANSNGNATIKAETSNGKIATCQVNVTTSGSGVYINKASVTLDLSQNNQVDLKATVVPSTTVDKSITWTSSNKNVAVVDSNGHVTAKSTGTAIITAKASTGKPGICTVKVDNQVTKITLNTTSTKIVLQDTDKAKLSVTSFTPSSATNKTVKWESSNKNVATVSSSGEVTAKNLGKTTIIATCGKARATCTVTVKYKREFNLYYYNTKTGTVSMSGSNTGDTYAFFMYIPDTEQCINLQALPLSMHLHGAGGATDPYKHQVYGINNALLNKRFEYDAIIISPIAHGTQESRNQTRLNAAKAIADYVAKNYKVNTKKISISGYSNGASGAWTLINQNKGYFSAALLISGHDYNMSNLSADGIPIIWVTRAKYNDITGQYNTLRSYLSKNGIKYRDDLLDAEWHSEALAAALENTNTYMNWLISQSCY